MKARFKPQSSFAKVFVFLVLACVIGCSSSLPLEQPGRWEVLPERVAELLVREPLDSNIPDRYITHFKREAFKPMSFEVDPELVVGVWHSNGISLEKSSYSEMDKARQEDGFNRQANLLEEDAATHEPYSTKHAQIDFVIRGHHSMDRFANILIVDYFGFGPHQAYWEMKLEWDGQSWNKVSLSQKPFPMPND